MDQECREKIASLEREIQDLRRDLLRYVQMDKRASSKFDAALRKIQEDITREVSELSDRSLKILEQLAAAKGDSIAQHVNEMLAQNQEAILGYIDTIIDEKIRNYLRHQ